MHLSNGHPMNLSCEASPYRNISRAVFVSFMFPEEGLIAESARNVIFHLLLLLFSHSTTLVCTRMAYSKPLPQRTPHPWRSRRLRGQEPSQERVAVFSPFRGPISPNRENPSPSITREGMKSICFVGELLVVLVKRRKLQLKCSSRDLEKEIVRGYV